MDVWRLRPSGGSPEQVTTTAPGDQFSRAARPHGGCSMSRARKTGRDHGSGCWMSPAVAVEPRAVGRGSIHVGVDQPRRQARRRDRRQPEWKPVARAAARPSRQGERRRTLSVTGSARPAAGATIRRERVVFPLDPRNARRALEAPGRQAIGGLWSAVRTAGVSRRTDDVLPSSCDKKGNDNCQSCPRTARTHERWRHRSK